MVLRDPDGAFRGGASFAFPGVVDPELAEVLACRKGVLLAAQTGVSRVHVDWTTKELQLCLKYTAINLSAVGPIIEDVKRILQSFEAFTVTWFRRSGNKLALEIQGLVICGT